METLLKASEADWALAKRRERVLSQVLTESAWHSRLSANDLRGITPLIYSHVNPYGCFRLDLNARLPIDPPRFGPQSLGTQLRLNYDEQAG